MQTEKPSIGIRLVSMLMDYFFTCFILIAPVWAIIFIRASSLDAGEEPMGAGFQFFFLGLMFVYFLKDSFKGRSLAKRIVKLQVVDNRTYQAATPLKCFIRNLFIKCAVKPIPRLRGRDGRHGRFLPL
jgi:uncharacterized RDD family membrane protein YckC